ncbi:MAG: sugar ABC transporter ATP-binding protein [Alphaproteobacteria bacterium]
MSLSATVPDAAVAGQPGQTKAAPSPGAAQAPLIEIRGVSKSFPGVKALDDVDFDLRPGEVHVLFGENGAGKSTLINIIAGTFAQDSGEFAFMGEPLRGLTPHRARVMGISPVFQEFSLVAEMTVEENLFLGREIARGGVLDRKAMRARSADIIQDLGFALEPNRKIADLSRAHQQMAEIVKALMGEVKVLILDEPTASLTERETVRLFELIAELKSQGVGIIYVSHRMAEIRELADRITVLRDGRLVKTLDAEGVGENELVELMTGRKIDLLFPPIDHQPAGTLLQIEGLTLLNGDAREIDFYARAGEITGIAGLVGCGKSELIRAVYGLEPIAAGDIKIAGETFAHPAPAASLARGVCYFPSDRVAEGLALGRPIRENVSVSALGLERFARKGIIKRLGERKLVQEIVGQLGLRPPNIERLAGNLSGGNRQKVMLSRGLTRETRVFLFDEPTVGIDVGAKVEVYDLMKALVGEGAAIVLVSSELPEVLHLCNRLYVMHQGRMVAELTGDDIEEQTVLACFFREDGDGVAA